MTANDLMGRYADVQLAIDGLLQLSRVVREHAVPLPGDLKLIEDGLFEVGHELLEIAGALKAEAEAAQAENEAALELLEQCQTLLARYEQQAEENGLVPAILADRALRGAPAESFQTERYEVEINAEAGVAVVRERRPALLPANVVALPTGLAREIYRQGRPRLGPETGGAA